MEEIRRLITEGLSDREIARTLHCRRTRVRQIRAELASRPPIVAGTAAEAPPLPCSSSMFTEPLWTVGLHWPSILEEIGKGFEIKRVWEERAAAVTGYPNFWKYLNRRHPWLMTETVTLREFAPGSQCEVDWAGDKIQYWDRRSGKPHDAHIFIGILCHSQLLFACAAENEQRQNWLNAHERMFAFFEGVPRITTPDNLKTGVIKTHRYDPDINPAYTELAIHYGTAVVPARVRRPKDKSLAENGVGLVMRLFRFAY